MKYILCCGDLSFCAKILRRSLFRNHSRFTEGLIPHGSQRDLFLMVHRGTYSSRFTKGPIPHGSQRDLFLTVHKGTYSSWFPEGPTVHGSQKDPLFVKLCVHNWLRPSD